MKRISWGQLQLLVRLGLEPGIFIALTQLGHAPVASLFRRLIYFNHEANIVSNVNNKYRTVIADDQMSSEFYENYQSKKH